MKTVIDGEVLVLDEAGKPSFSLLQNMGSSHQQVHFYVFDLLVLAGKRVINQPLTERRELLRTRVLPHLSEPIRFSPDLIHPLPDLPPIGQAAGSRRLSG